MGEIYKHMSGIKGLFDKKYRPTGETRQYIRIRTYDGRLFYAPASEFVCIDS